MSRLPHSLSGYLSHLGVLGAWRRVRVLITSINFYPLTSQSASDSQLVIEGAWQVGGRYAGADTLAEAPGHSLGHPGRGRVGKGCSLGPKPLSQVGEQGLRSLGVSPPDEDENHST